MHVSELGNYYIHPGPPGAYDKLAIWSRAHQFYDMTGQSLPSIQSWLRTPTIVLSIAFAYIPTWSSCRNIFQLESVYVCCSFR